MAAVELDLPVALALCSARAGRRHDPVAAGPNGEGRHRRLDPELDLEGRLVHPMAGDQLVEPPDIVVARIAGKGRAERDHLGDEVGPELGRLAGVDAAQAPADADHRPALSKVLAPGGEPLQCVFTNASAPAHAPSTTPITGATQRPLKTESPPVGGQQTRAKP